MDALKILFAASEAFPFAKSGGLGDVIGSLPKALAKMNTDVRVIIPKYSSISSQYVQKFKFLNYFNVKVGCEEHYVGIFEYKKDNVTFYFVDNEHFFSRDHLYGDYDDAERFIFFSRAVLECIPHIDFFPDILHCHDWQTALIPFFLKEQYHWHYLNTKSVFTIHNIKYQGLYGFDDLNALLNLEYFPGAMEFYDKLNLMKGALYSSDLVTTVSPSYAEELKDPYYGENLDGVIRDIDFKLHGILNGIDESVYNPQTDPDIFTPYSTFSGKVKNKQALQNYMDLPINPNIPILSMVTRLVEQKGLDLIAGVIHEILQMDLQLVILGTGESQYENLFRELAYAYPKKVRTYIEFDESLSRKIYAGSDFFLMPSKFEPCGLSQMICMRYGTVPIVRETGGLKDTIHYYNCNTKKGNGYCFTTYNAHDMLYTIQAAVGLFSDYKSDWQQLVNNCFNTHFNWQMAAETYLYFYRKMTNKL